MLCLSQPLIVQAPTIPYEGSLILIDGNSVISFYAVNEPYTSDLTKDDIIDLIREKYPELADLLICMLKKESSYCRDMRGDKGLAYGCFQIHIDKHDITEWCAMDFECSLDFTAQKIKEGKGNLWTTYKKCLTK